MPTEQNKVDSGPRITRVAPWVLVLIVLSLPIWLSPNPVPLRDFGVTDVLQLLAALTTIALFLERALEVFITTTRGAQASLLDVKLEAARRELTEAQQAASKSAKQAGLRAAEQEKAQYKSQTHKMALWAGVIFGLVVSAAGIRTLETLVAPNALEEVPDMQVFVFHLADVLLTGGLLAGGADGLHKLTQVYTNYMESTSERAKGKPS